LARSKVQKQQTVAELKELLERSQAVIISDYRGLTAGQMAELRGRLRRLDSRFLVAQNSLVLRSLSELGLPQPTAALEGPTAMGFCFGDIRAPARAMLDFARETDLLHVKGGLLGQRIMAPADVQTLVDLPGTDVLRALVVASVQSPVTGLVGLVEGALRGLLYALNAKAEQMGAATAQ